MSVLESRYYTGPGWAERFQADLLAEKYPHVESEGFSEWLEVEGRKKYLEPAIIAYVDWLETIR